MQLSYDIAKRNWTLTERGLDFAAFPELFAGTTTHTRQDKRQDYGEDRFVTVGYLGSRLVVAVWTQRGEVYHVISMRKANDREKEQYKKVLHR